MEYSRHKAIGSSQDAMTVIEGWTIVRSSCVPPNHPVSRRRPQVPAIPCPDSPLLAVATPGRSGVRDFSECSAENQRPFRGHRHTERDIPCEGGAGRTSTALACGQFITDTTVVSSISGGRRCAGNALSLHHPGTPIPYPIRSVPSAQNFRASTAIVDTDACGDLRAMDERGVLADALTLLGDHARRHGATVIAAFHYADALALHYELGARLEIARCLERVAHLASVRGKPVHATWFLGSAATTRRAVGAPPIPTEELELQTTLTAVRAKLDEATFSAAWVSGEHLPHEEAIAQALAFLLEPVDVGAALPAQTKAGKRRESGWA
jgi:hypothetical protein